MENTYLITLATHDDGYYNALKKSADINGYNLITLGWGKKWEGFIMKYKLLLENISNYNDNDIIILVDAYDVIVTDKKEVAIEKFKTFNIPLLLSKDGHTGNSIFNYLHDKIFDTCNNYNICAGLMMGYVWALKNLIYLMCGNNLDKCKQLNMDDQILLTDTCNNNKLYKTLLKIDINSDIFFNTFGNVNKLEFSFKIKDIFDIRQNKLYIKNTDNNPCFIHGPGNTDLNNLCKFYNLPSGKESNRDLGYRLKLYTKPQYLDKFSDEINKLLIAIVLITIILIILWIRDIIKLKLNKYK
jgi:hypothetical protein